MPTQGVVAGAQSAELLSGINNEGIVVATLGVIAVVFAVSSSTGHAAHTMRLRTSTVA